MTFSTMIEQLADGMMGSMGIFFLTLIFSLPLGLLIAFGKMSKFKIISIPVNKVNNYIIHIRISFHINQLT